MKRKRDTDEERREDAIKARLRKHESQIQINSLLFLLCVDIDERRRNEKRGWIEGTLKQNQDKSSVFLLCRGNEREDESLTEVDSATV